MNPDSRRVWVDGQEVQLRPKEFGVLAVLLRAAGGVVTPVALFDAVWGEENDTDDAVVKTVIHSLRKKIGTDTIRTVHGVGYRIEGS